MIAAAELARARPRAAAARDAPRALARAARRPSRRTAAQVERRRRVRRLSGQRASTAARSSPTRSRAARRAVLWERRGFDWDARLGRAQPRASSGLRGAARRRSPTSSTATRRATLWMVGVTGTNGKTSCAQWIAQALDGCGRRAAVIGTLGNGLVGALDAGDEHHAGRRGAAARRSRDSATRGAKAVAMEVSSHRARPGPRQRHRRSTSRCSPTSRATTSTTTARWRPTARRRRGCSTGRGSRTR